MKLLTLLNTAWMWKCRPELARFLTSTEQVDDIQRQILMETLTRNGSCEYGQRYQFDSIRDVSEFRRRVPIVNHDDLMPSIKRIAAGESVVLTTEPVELLEPTSGTTAGCRLVPYTRTLKRQFQRAIAAWIGDLFSARPSIRRGRSYWSITPNFKRGERTAGGLRIGFSDDTDYLGNLERFVAHRLMAVPTATINNASNEDYRYVTLLHLLACPDLSLISVWSPTFLSSLVRPLEEWSTRLVEDLRPLASPTRVVEVAEILNDSSAALADRYARLWPHLALISCWADGSAATYVSEIRQLFPAVEIQPKGLLSTECCVSFPLVDQPGSALAIRSHFFEFAADGATATCLADEIEIGRKYRVIVTTGGGLYRYDTGDWIEVVGTKNDCPLIRFVGRESTSDLVGEKLNETFLQTVIASLFANSPVKPSFATFVPCRSLRQYHLLLQFEVGSGRETPEVLAARLQELLNENPYYRHAVEIGQLQRTHVHIVDPRQICLWERYERVCIDRGIRAGDIKPMFLDKLTDWSDVIDGRLTHCMSVVGRGTEPD